MARVGGKAHQQAGRRRLHACPRYPHERHRDGGAALSACLRAHESRAAACRWRRCGASSTTSNDGQLAARRRPFAARDHHWLRAGRHRGDRCAGPAGAGPVSRAGLSLRPARGLRPPVPVLGADRSAGGEGLQQHPAELYRHVTRPAHRGRASRSGGRRAAALRSSESRAVDQAQRVDAGRGGTANPRLLHEHRSDVRRPAGASAVRGDRFDRAAARHPLRVAARPGAIARSKTG